jgi:hypothetical protein
MVTKLVFKENNFKGEISAKEFSADILIEGMHIKGEPLVTLNENDGLPSVKEVYARWGEPAGKEESTEVVSLTAKFDDEIAEDGKLKGSLTINMYVEGATNYIMKWSS